MARVPSPWKIELRGRYRTRQGEAWRLARPAVPADLVDELRALAESATFE